MSPFFHGHATFPMYGEIVSQRFEADVDNKRGPLLASTLFNNFDVTLLYHMSEITNLMRYPPM